MPIGLGLAISHAPGMYAKNQEKWDGMWHYMSVRRGIPQPAYVYEETGENLKDMVSRIEACHEKMVEELKAYDPELLIIIGGDQTEMFDRSNVPQLMIFTGPTAYGFRERDFWLADPAPTARIECEVNVEESKHILNKLVKDYGFDVAFSDQIENFGRADGLPHAFIYMLQYIEEKKIPTVLIYENTYDPPSLSAGRCYDLGQALAQICQNRDKKVAIIGSGGLGHDPGGKRSGWLDQPLDHWFLDKIADGDGKATTALFSYDSDTMVSGTGEIRAWITVAGAMEAMGSRAKVVDYIPAGKTVSGLSAAYWETEQPLMDPAR